jgi:hypothetical protein
MTVANGGSPSSASGAVQMHEDADASDALTPEGRAAAEAARFAPDWAGPHWMETGD